MNQVSFGAAFILALSVPLAANAQAMGGMSAGTTASSTAHATGVVKKVDAGAGIVTIAHEAIPAIGWPPMTMGFHVEDKKLFGKLVVGQKVDFDLAMSGKGYVVTQVR